MVFDENYPSTYERVNHPQHYQGKGIEVINTIDAFDLGFCLGNAVKYILRCDKKGNRVEDLRKAIWYLNREIENTRSVENGK